MNSCNCNQNFNECGKCARASLRDIAPSCKTIAIIPSITVENLQSMKGLADCFVHVISNNTTYYIDNNSRLTILSEGLVTADNYDILANPLKLQNQLLSTKIDNVQQVVFYDAQRRPHELAVMDNVGPLVVEEVNNKIEDMAQDGALEDIINETFNANYIYDEIEITEGLHTATNTHYYLVHIPHEDSDGNLIKIQHGIANDAYDFDMSASETALHYAQRTNATFCTNASIFSVDPDFHYHQPVGPIIKDGTLVYNIERSNYPEHTKILGIKADNTLKQYDLRVTPEQLLNDGVVNSVVGFDQVIINGEIHAYHDGELNKYLFIGQNSTTKDIYFLACNGRDIDFEKGMTMEDCCQILLDAGCDFAYRLDNGGSTTLVYKSTVINEMSDQVGTVIRKVPDFLYFAKDLQNEVQKTDNDIRNHIGKLSAEVDAIKNKLLYIQDVYDSRVRFYHPNPVYPDGDSFLSLALYKQAGTADEYHDSSLILSPSSSPKSLNIWDGENNKTIASIDGLNEKIQLNGKELATLFSTIKQSTSDVDIDSLDKFTIIWIPSAPTVNPPFGTYDYILINIPVDLNGEAKATYQIALALTGYFGQQSQYNPAIRLKVWNGNWGNWHYLNIT